MCWCNFIQGNSRPHACLDGTDFNIETAKYESTELGAKKGEIIEAVKKYVVDYFKNYGITITVLGLKEGISFENPAIQTAIDEKFASEQKLVIQQNENAANLAKAEADAKAELELAKAKAEANRLLTESLTPQILEQMYYQKWNGVLPTVVGESTPIIKMP